MFDLSEQDREHVLNYVRNAIRAALSGAERLEPDLDHPAMAQPAGCFVSLHKTGSHKLRGCIGRIDAAGPLGRALRSSAHGVLHDPRFVDDPVTLAELPELEVEVSVLSPLTIAATPLDFDPLRHGIVLTFGNRTGCFLPQVARETGWTREQLLDRLCTEKLGLPALIWRNPHVQLQTFDALVVGPVGF